LHEQELKRSEFRFVEGDEVLAIGQLKDILLMDLESGKTLGHFQGHTEKTAALAEIPDRGILVSGGHDRTIRLWDLKRQEQITELRGDLDVIHALAVTPDGKTIFSASGDYTVRRWDTRPQRAVLQARVEYKETASRLAPRLQRRFDELNNPDAVAEKFKNDTDLTDRERQISLQLVLKEAISRRKSADAPPAEAEQR